LVGGAERDTSGDPYMRVDVIGRHFEVTDAIRQYAWNKAEKLSKYFDGLQAVTVTIQPHDHTNSPQYEVELVLDVEKHADFIAKATAKDPYAAIDVASEKGERQLRDFKEKLKQNKH